VFTWPGRGEGEQVGIGDIGDVGELAHGSAVAVDLDVRCASGGDGEGLGYDPGLIAVAVGADRAGDGEAAQRDRREGAGSRLVADELIWRQLQSPTPLPRHSTIPDPLHNHHDGLVWEHVFDRLGACCS
jgi:hypothetical protein